YSVTTSHVTMYHVNNQLSSLLYNTTLPFIVHTLSLHDALPIFTDQGPLLLSRPGTYTLLVEGFYGDTGNGTYGFNVVPVSDGLQALKLGSVVCGAVGAPGQHQQYTFTLPGAARLYLDSLTNRVQ